MTAERQTIGEGYSVAVNGGRSMRISGDGHSDADLILAAGMSRHPIGIALLRLKAEYDAVHEQISHVQATAASAGEIVTERFLILSQLTTLRSTKAAVGARAQWLATKRRFMQGPTVVDKLAGQVLDVLLNPTCHHCSGTAVAGSVYRGESDDPCRPCRGTGQRRYSLGSDERSRWFAGDLLADMQSQMAQAAGGMGRLMRRPQEKLTRERVLT
jgi:hypothetical protein